MKDQLVVPSALIAQLAAYSFVRLLPALAEDGSGAVPYLHSCWRSEFWGHSVCWVRR